MADNNRPFLYSLRMIMIWEGRSFIQGRAGRSREGQEAIYLVINTHLVVVDLLFLINHSLILTSFKKLYWLPKLLLSGFPSRLIHSCLN